MNGNPEDKIVCCECQEAFYDTDYRKEVCPDCEQCAREYGMEIGSE